MLGALIGSDQGVFFFWGGEVLVQNVFCCVCFRGWPTEMHPMGDISIFD